MSDSHAVPRAMYATPRFTLRQLEAFAAVMRLGGISPAARALSRTQSAVSMAIQDLEAALGDELFTRIGRRLTATETADRLLPQAIEMIDRARDIASTVAGPLGTHHPVAIGASRTIGPALLPTILERCREQLPMLRVTLTVGNSEALLAKIRAFDLDVAFVEGGVTDSGLEVQPWLTDRLCLVARAEHPIFRRSGGISRAIDKVRWVLRERGSGTRELFMRAIEPLIGAPDIAVEVDEPETQKRIVRHSDFITCLSERSFDPATDGLRELKGLEPALRRALSRRFWLVRNPQRYQSAAVEAVITAARAAKPE